MGSEYSNGTYSSLFSLGRHPPFPAIYPENKTPVTYDVLEIGWITSALTAFVCFLLFLPALPYKEKVIYFFRLSLTLLIGIVIILCNFGQEWEVGQIQSPMLYKAGSAEEIHGQVGVKIGLRSVNITLKALEPPAGDLLGEKIDYNERFSWGWNQGRPGFGPYAGQIQREFRQAQLRGVPYPILWVAEYFTFDGEGLRFGRHYRYAGWYSHICIWTAFAVWGLTVILFKLVIRYGAILLAILGSLLTTSALIWCSVRNFNELSVVFGDEPSRILRTRYGTHWYLALVFGIGCTICGFILFLLDFWYHDQLSKFFGNNPFAILDEQYGDTIPTGEKLEEDYQGQDIELQGRTASMRLRRQVTYRAKGTTNYNKVLSEYSDVDSMASGSTWPTGSTQPTLDFGYSSERPLDPRLQEEYQGSFPPVPDRRHLGQVLFLMSSPSINAGISSSESN